MRATTAVVIGEEQPRRLNGTGYGHGSNTNVAHAPRTTARVPAKPTRPRPPRQPKGKPEYMQYAAGALAACAAGILTISMTHLAEGFARFNPTWMAWVLAAIFDITQVCCEVGLIVTAGHAVHDGTKWALWCIVGACTTVSIGMNVAAFSATATGPWALGCYAALGVTLPLVVLGLFHVASKMAIAGSK